MYEALKKFGTVKLNEPLGKHTTFKIGGPADLFLTVQSVEMLVEALRFLDGEGAPYFIFGGGSNMLVRDEGYRGVAVKLKDETVNIEDTLLQAAAGCITVDIAQKSIAAGLTGFEWGVGVPGTIGGAVRGNAGAMGGEMKDVVEQVEVYLDGEVTMFTNAECAFGYRESAFKHHGGVVLRVWLRLQPAENKEGMKRAIQHLQYRNKTQPQGHASTGCIFKNFEVSDKNENFKIDVPEDFLKKGKISAGWLVEQSGMKGVRIGKAEVSARHGNFIVNLGGASAQDVLTLIEQVKEKVYDTSGVSIEEEIQII